VGLLVGTVLGCGGSGSTGPSCDAIAAALVSRIELHPTAATIAIGDTLQFQAVAFSCAGELTDIKTFQWRSGNTSFATVNSTGRVIGVASGNLSIYAAAGGKEGFASVFIRPPRVARVTVEPDSVTIVLGQTTTLEARAFDSHGHELTGRTVTWSSAHSNIADVDADGVVTGRFLGGPVAVTATIEGKSDSSMVTVVLFVSPPR
jgi:uncharacterized protein YjdB